MSISLEENGLHCLLHLCSSLWCFPGPQMLSSLSSSATKGTEVKVSPWRGLASLPTEQQNVGLQTQVLSEQWHGCDSRGPCSLPVGIWPGMHSCCGPLVCFALSLLDFQSCLVPVAGDANQGDWDCWSVLSVNLYEFTIGP